MTLLIEVPPEVESCARQEAALAGLAPSELIVDALQARFSRTPKAGTVLSLEESRLITIINTVLPNETRQRYRELTQKCRQESITELEHAELLPLIEQVESLHATRVEAVFRLSQLRKADFTETMKQMGLTDPGYE